MKTMLLKEAIRQKIVTVSHPLEGNEHILIPGDIVDYKLDERQCTITTRITGWEREQTFKTEELGWRLGMFDNRILLVSRRATMHTLWLQGKTGYEKGIEAMNLPCSELYSNHLADRVINMTKEILRTKSILTCGIPYWISSQRTYTFERINNCGKVVASEMLVCAGDSILKQTLFESNGNIDSNFFGVRPVVFLKSGLQVVISDKSNGSEEKPWQIVEG